MLSKRGGPRAHTMLAVFLLAIMLGSPLLPDIATSDLARAQDGEDAEEVAQADQPTEEPTAPVEAPGLTPEPPGDIATRATDEPTVGPPPDSPDLPLTVQPELSTQVITPPTQIPTATDSAGDGSVVFAKYYCPPGYDPAGKTVDTMRVDCAAPGPTAAFTISGPGFQRDISLKASTSIVVSDLPLVLDPDDTITIRESVPPDYGDPILWCGYTGAGFTRFKATSGIVEVDIDPWSRENYACYIFNIPVPANSHLIIEKFACPPGIDLASASLETLMAECVDPMPGVGFAVSANGLETRQQTDDTGTLIIEDVPPGPAMIEENMPDGYDDTRVYCSRTNPDGTEGPFAELPTFGDLGTQTDLTIDGSGATYTCLWFNVIAGESEGGMQEPDPIPDNPVGTPPMLLGPLMLTGGGTGEIDLHVLLCREPDYTFDTFTRSDMGDCIPGETGVTFTATDDSGYTETSAPSDGSWRVYFDNVPLDTPITITRNVPSGLGAPFATCDQGNGVLSVVPATNGIQATVETPQTGAAKIQCIWFTVPTTGIPTVSVDNHICPPTLPFDPQSATYEEFAAICTDPGANIQFETYDAEVEGPFERPVSDANGHFEHEVNPGTLVTVVQTMPAGYGPVHVFCNYGSADVPAGPYLRPETSDDFARSHPLAGGYTWDCQWFNVLADAEHPESTVDIHITKYLCSPFMDRSTLALEGIPADCYIEPGSVEFTVSNGAYQATLVAESGNTYAATGVPSGDITVTEAESTIAHTHPLAARCVVEDLATGATTALPLHLEPIPLTATLADGQVLRCDWLNKYEEDTPGLVSITKVFCPAGYAAYDDPLAELAQSCLTSPTAEPDPVEFTLSADQYSSTQSTINTGMGYQTALFDHVPGGTLTILETVPAGFGEPIVICIIANDVQVVPEGADPFDYFTRLLVVDGSTINIELDPADSLICIWANVLQDQTGDPGTEQPAEQPTEQPMEEPTAQPEDDTATVSVIKYACPEGTSSGENESFYMDTCTLAAGIEFRMTNGHGSAMGATDAAGEYTWSNVPLGPASLQEYIPTGYGEPMVFCNYTYTERPAIDAAGGYIQFEIAEPGDWICLVYNIPAGEGDITIYKHTCPGGYNPHAWNADPATDCTEGPNGVPFTAAGPNGYQHQSTTGDSTPYTVSFGELEPGAYTITEHAPSGTALTFVWNCYGQTMGELRPTPLSVGSTLQITLDAGEAIACHWYNVPADPDGKLTVIKYTCVTQTYISDIDCQIHESGQGFDLAWWNGNEWEITSSGITSGAGSYTWYNLDAGEYWLDEHDRDWCYLASDQLSDDGNWLNVHEGEETVVKVYNCTSDPAAKGKPGPIPTKYPNTGVPLRENWRRTS